MIRSNKFPIFTNICNNNISDGHIFGVDSEYTDEVVDYDFFTNKKKSIFKNQDRDSLMIDKLQIVDDVLFIVMNNELIGGTKQIIHKIKENINTPIKIKIIIYKPILNHDKNYIVGLSSNYDFGRLFLFYDIIKEIPMVYKINISHDDGLYPNYNINTIGDMIYITGGNFIKYYDIRSGGTELFNIQMDNIIYYKTDICNCTHIIAKYINANTNNEILEKFEPRMRKYIRLCEIPYYHNFIPWTECYSKSLCIYPECMYGDNRDLQIFQFVNVNNGFVKEYTIQTEYKKSYYGIVSFANITPTFINGIPLLFYASSNDTYISCL